tara:strand:- start:52 stop:1593 length:1542 start_codon:yes stop_codon:yes gene_type:complete
MKNFKFFGHASIYLESETTSIVTDPWFSKKGAYASSWFQYPDNTNIDFSWLDNLDYVCLSHEHEDHCDIDFLKRLNPTTKIVTANFTNKRYLRSLQNNLVNDIIEVDDRTTLDLGDIKYTPMIQIPMGQEDSAMIFEVDNEVILNFNDMKPSQKDIDWIKERYKVNYMLKQYSGASWYPLVYDYDEIKVKELSIDKRLFKYDVIANVMNELQPDYYIPFAGPPCFLRDETFHINFIEENTLPNQAEIYSFFKQNHPDLSDKFIVLMPGDSVYDDWKDNLQQECFTDKKNYLTKYKERREQIIEESLSKIKLVDSSLLKKAVNYFLPLMKSAPRLCNNIECKVIFNVKGDFEETIMLDFEKRKVSNKFDSKTLSYKPTYEFDIEGKWLNHIFERNMTWEEFFLTLNFKARRKPDLYSENLMAFLKLADPVSYKEYEDFHFSDDEAELFDLDYNDKQYKCQRYCPHARGDLSKGKVVDGKLVCPTHNWKFSLPDGQCTTNDSKLIIERKNSLLLK